MPAYAKIGNLCKKGKKPNQCFTIYCWEKGLYERRNVYANVSWTTEKCSNIKTRPSDCGIISASKKTNIGQKPCTWRKGIYRYSNGQISRSDFKQPVGMNLKESNRWIKKVQTIPWLEIEKRYAALFTKRKGNVAKQWDLGPNWTLAW